MPGATPPLLSGVPQSLAESVFIALIVAALALLLSVPAARAIALHSFRGKQAVLFVLLLPVLAPPWLQQWAFTPSSSAWDSRRPFGA